MKIVLCAVCLSLCLAAAAVAGEVKTIAMNGVPAPVVVAVAAGQMMRILACVYDGVDTVNGNPASPVLVYTPSTQTQGINLHAGLLKQALVQAPQGVYLAGPAKVVFNGANLSREFFLDYEIVPSVR
ncbi:MAG TPA: hypothetical protein VGS07_23620 [Thermoanaerobaculia bacterium]|jgi:hypothetical protein|nr:hypothetical protein [Thermoanaerobaculia bacterium]